MKKSDKKTIAVNKKAYHDYDVEQKFEAGIELFGTEVKSIRNGRVSLKNSYCFVEDGEIYVHNMHVIPYEFGNVFNKDPIRKRRLLLHKREILNLYFDARKQGYSIIALSLYFVGQHVKVEIGLCRGKKLYDKRASLKEKEIKLRMDRAIKKFFN